MGAGPKALDRLEENLGAVNVHLTAKELAYLNEALDKIKISGDRYPVGFDAAKWVGK